ncbi:hypothetical protein USDA257_c52350 [Sinorhizobium fredii USDA 257]|uniref:Uncharacterized protein n=1 Tax=Sinorhizobium fredii (strain USDA 257) TaxID=1185652 RepID=I3XD04_SINF2|nr:hypothetical protein USDA257_c52350 [Sinorhizobium fredii USDA 257]
MTARGAVPTGIATAGHCKSAAKTIALYATKSDGRMTSRR